MITKTLFTFFLLTSFSGFCQLDTSKIIKEYFNSVEIVEIKKSTITSKPDDCVDGVKWADKCPYTSNKAITDTLQFTIKRLHSTDGENKFLLLAPSTKQNDVESFFLQQEIDFDSKLTEGEITTWDFKIEFPVNPTQFDIVPVPIKEEEGCFVPCDMKIE
ncbi:MAG: hypothetical protein ACFHU9_01575 [Fluviicola sp.]